MEKLIDFNDVKETILFEYDIYIKDKKMFEKWFEKHFVSGLTDTHFIMILAEYFLKGYQSHLEIKKNITYK